MMGGMSADTRPDDYSTSTALSDMDLDRVHHWLSTDAYWALGRTRDKVELAARHSLNFGVFTGDRQQVAYARVLTDHASFAWLCDVYVDPTHRGRGVGGRLLDVVVAELEPMGLRRAVLATRDAHDVYARVGFEPLPRPQDWMIRLF